MKRSNDDSFVAEEMELAISNLAALTTEGSLQWKLIDYTPVMLMPTNNNQEAYLGHKIQTTVTHNHHEFFLELSEWIYLPSGKGDISILFAPNWSGNPEYCKSISDDELFDTSSPNEIFRKFQSTPLVIIADAVIPQLESSIASFIATSSPHPVRLCPPRFENAPIVKLARKLSNAGHFVDLHRCVLDPQYRSKLLSNL